MNVIKRDGRRRKFNPTKIVTAIQSALIASKVDFDETGLDEVSDRVIEKVNELGKASVSVETINSIVGKELMASYPDAAECFILYREERNRVRNTKSEIVKTIREITESNIASSNILRDNANESGATPAGAYGKIASETNKMYNLLDKIDRKYAQEHKDGHMHIHDLNQYNLTFNCLFAPVGKLLKSGFDSGTGFLRDTKRIESAAQLTAVIMQLQSNQQYGGIADDNIDFDLAPFVDISFKKNLATELVRQRVYTGIYPETVLDGDPDDEESPLGKMTKKVFNEEVEPSGISMNQPTGEIFARFDQFPKLCVKAAIQQTDHDTFEGMEGLIGNLNSLQSRSGNQVPFSSLNFGLDTSRCGRMVSKNLIKAQYAGLGDGLTAIFPILIFKLMKGYTQNAADPNYDLKMDSIKCLARRFYPNFVSVDSSFNKPYVKYEEKEVIADSDVIRVKVRGKDESIGHFGNYECGEYPEYEYETAPGDYWELVSFKDGIIKLRKLIPNTTIAAMGCARGDETITIKVDGIVYRNIKISEAYDMIHEMALIKEQMVNPSKEEN